MITFKEYLLDQELNEIFDHPWKTEFDKDATGYARNDAKTKAPSLKNIQVHKVLDDIGGHILMYKDCSHAAPTEIHHMDSEGRSGKLNYKTESNPRFVSTMIHLAKKHILDRAESCRIVVPKSAQGGESQEELDRLHGHYSRLASYIAKKHHHEIEHGEGISANREVRTITIHPNHSSPMGSIIGESVKSYYKSRT